MAVTALAAMAPSQALDPLGVGPRDATRAGFPAFYTDDSGVALQLCVDGTARCGRATLRSDGAGGPGVSVAPDGEGFYSLATASLSDPDPVTGFNINVEVAAEAAWASRQAPITFDRLRIRGHSNAAGPLTVQTPYGNFRVTAGPATAPVNVNFTQDVGCPGRNCDFTAMVTKPRAHITSWITNNTHPAGYLGNAVRPQPSNVAGAPAILTVLGSTASTTRWVVTGKIAPAAG
jgi:hypothetical protein